MRRRPAIDAREAQDGTRYAKFHARVFVNSSDRTTVNILDANGAMPGEMPEPTWQTWQVLPPLEPQQ